MATVSEHYKDVLGEIYSWMQGGYEAGIAANTDYFRRHGVKPEGSGIAVDLGAGCGFQSIALAELGFEVTAFDIDAGLLAELRENMGGRDIKTLEADIRRFRDYLPDSVELAVCMTDTVLHLDTPQEVMDLFSEVYKALEPGGKFIITFRDLTGELKDLERFIPVRSDADRVLTCFLEYEAEKVKVHDLLYTRENESWKFKKSFYYKLRLSAEWLEEELVRAGFSGITSDMVRGLITLAAQK